MGFNSNNIPDISILKMLFHDLSIDILYEINLELIDELYSLYRLKLENFATNSFLIESYFKPPTKNGKKTSDPEAT